jgi:hypothetical protein
MLNIGIIIVLIACGLPFGALYFAGDAGMSVKEFADWVLASKYLLGIGTILAVFGAVLSEPPKKE